MAKHQSIFAEEWKQHHRQASWQRFGVSMAVAVMGSALGYLERPWHELIVFCIAAGIFGFLSEISLDLKGMRLMMAERREQAIGMGDNDWD